MSESMYGRPTAGELLEAVREFLEGDVLAATTGRVKFHTRVAINVLAIVERELAAGTQPTLDHEDRLNSLGVGDEGELAQLIRSGGLDDRLAEVARLLRPSVDDRLAVANPRYSG